MAVVILGLVMNLSCCNGDNNSFGISDFVEYLFNLYLVCHLRKREGKRGKEENIYIFDEMYFYFLLCVVLICCVM